MKSRNRWILTAIFICCLSSLCIGFTDTQRKSLPTLMGSPLQGLKGVRIVFMVTDLEYEKRIERPSEYIYMYPENWNNEFRTEAELVLRRNGIKIFSGEVTTKEKEKMLSASLYVLVVVNVLKVHNAPYIYAFTVSVTIEDFVLTCREPCVFTKATTWSFCQIEPKIPVICGKIHLKQRMKENILKQITAFCNDYLTANPKVDKSALEKSPKPK